jgi:hypothetical protein
LHRSQAFELNQRSDIPVLLTISSSVLVIRKYNQ